MPLTGRREPVGTDDLQQSLAVAEECGETRLAPPKPSGEV